MANTSWAEQLADQFDDQLLTETGEALDRIGSKIVEGSTTFQEELDQELKIARSAIMNAICLRLGEIALEACPPDQESEIMRAATTLANPRAADPREEVKAKETLAQYL